jgi:hypothetical protein
VEAARWFERAAAKGHRGAQRNLADCYREGTGVAHDPSKAIALMRTLIEGDPCQAAFELAEWYAAGNGIPRDPAMAIHYFRLARDHDHPSAAECLRELGVKVGRRDWPSIGQTPHPAVVRTSYSDASARAWHEIQEEILKPVGEQRFVARVTWCDDPAYATMRTNDLFDAVSDDYAHPFIVLVDDHAMGTIGHRVLVIAWSKVPGREFRALSSALQTIENNLSLGSLRLDDFADAAEASPGQVFGVDASSSLRKRS